MDVTNSAPSGARPDAIDPADATQRHLRLAGERLLGLLADALSGMPLRRFVWLELPPPSWTPDQRRSDLEDDQEIADNVRFIKSDNATREQLELAQAFAIWQLEPDLQRLACILLRLARLDGEGAGR